MFIISKWSTYIFAKNYHYEDFFENKVHAVYYENHLDLAENIKKYSNNYNERFNISLNGKKRYFELFENTKVTKYMIEKIFDKKFQID